MTFTLLYWGGPKPGSRLFHSARLFAPHSAQGARHSWRAFCGSIFYKDWVRFAKLYRNFAIERLTVRISRIWRLSSSVLLLMGTRYDEHTAG